MALSPKKKKIDRRQFVGFAWALSSLGLLGQAGVALLEFFKPRPGAGGFGSLIIAGNIDEFPPGSVNYVRKGRFYVVHTEDGGLLALWSRCTHLGCTVPFDKDADRFGCPCHSSIFNLHGEVLDGPAPRPLDLFAISIEEHSLVVDTSKPIERQAFDETQYFFPG